MKDFYPGIIICLALVAVFWYGLGSDDQEAEQLRLEQEAAEQQQAEAERSFGTVSRIRTHHNNFPPDNREPVNPRPMKDDTSASGKSNLSEIYLRGYNDGYDDGVDHDGEPDEDDNEYEYC